MTDPLLFPIGLALNGIAHAPQDDASARRTEARWLDALRRADDAGLDFATFEDRWARGSAFGQSPLDATLLLSRAGPATRRIGLIPSVAVSTNEPFHISTAIATLDYVTRGRAGLLPQVPAESDVEAALAHAGSRIYGLPDERDGLYRDAADALDAVRRLWDSWEEGAIIRDVDTGRFVDRDKLHYVDVDAATFSIKGPSIVPRPPQGQPPVAVAWREARDLEWAAAHADIVFVPPPQGEADWAPVRQILAAAQEQGGRSLAPLRYYADVAVAFGGDGPLADAQGVAAHTGTAQALAERIQHWRALGFSGVRLHPQDLDRDLDGVIRELLPLLRGPGSPAAPTPEAGQRPLSLRSRLGLAEASNRYAALAGHGGR
jgi:alkanesulfonate monooxygenase SsuD/methylene tetrahydromethanopterin reductase-like flavin-dependent oxidoreductase (luciferase family)